ncbi:MAG: glycosyltransferase family 2 protein [Shimia sp.]
MRLEVAVFSYNRPAYLAQCLASLAAQMPGVPVTVYDDRSDDPAQLRLLEDWGVPVVRPSATEKARHGGLYANMDRALAGTRAEWVLFLQDDMQVVRPFGARDADQVAALFDAVPGRAFVAPWFVKGVRRRRAGRGLRPEGAAGFAGYLAYADVSIGHVARLRAAGWRFGPTEAEAEARARATFDGMALMRDPFVFFCPEVPVYRGRARGLSSRLAARVVGTEAKGFAPMPSEAVAALRTRPPSALPVAEDWLTPTDPRTRRPFAYKDVGARWWLRALARIETALRGRA